MIFNILSVLLLTFGSVYSYTEMAKLDQIKDLPGSNNLNITFNHFSGYIPVGESKQIHYWFVESMNDPSNDPVTFWTNGGPGCSGLIGFLTEQGPFKPNKEMNLVLNPYAWNKVSNMVFVEIPAGVGFGTGHHPSTKGILYVLSKIYLKKNINYNNIIDVGCGSGILGITMAKLWKKPIELIDIDKRSIKTSQTNAKLNFVNSLIKVKKGNGLNITSQFQYDIIVMNILANTILKNIKLIDKKLNNNGRAIIAGILNHQKYMILNKLRGLGLVLELEYIINGWVTLLIKKN